MLGVGVDLVAAHLVEVVPLAEHAIEFVDKQGHGFVAFVGLHGRVHVRTLDFNVAFGFEPVGDVLIAIALEFHADPDDAVLVSKQSLRFLTNEKLKRRCEFKVNAGDDDFVVVLSVHDTALLLGFTKAAADHLPRPKFVPLELVSSPREALQTFSAVVLTGGSSGIGKSFIELAGKMLPELRFCNLSRSKPDIKSGQLNVCHIGCDLSDAADLARAADGVIDWLTREAPAGQILLINNSGFGAYGRFPEPNLDRQLQLLDLNIRALVDLTGRLLPTLRQRGGAVMNIASTAAFQPMPFMATYGASKAFVLHWTLALNEELRGTKVRAIAVCPGPTETKFFQQAGLKEDGKKGPANMSPEDVVMQAIRALGQRRSLVVTGMANKLSAAIGGMAPKRVAARIAGKLVARTRMERLPT